MKEGRGTGHLGPQRLQVPHDVDHQPRGKRRPGGDGAPTVAGSVRRWRCVEGGVERHQMFEERSETTKSVKIKLGVEG